VTILDLLFEAWPDETPPPVARLRDAIEETYAAAQALGFDPEAIYAAQAPFTMRCDAWLQRTQRLLRRAA
jgi:hypothetical protein